MQDEVNNMENKYPKNVRQIGNVSDTPKIYIEDYVDTFLNHLSEENKEEVVGAVLIGKTEQNETQESIYISGAVKVEETTMTDTDLFFNADIWKAVHDKRDEYFPNEEIIGWFLSQPGQPSLLTSELAILHEKYFDHSHSVLIIRNSTENEEQFYTYKFHQLMEIGGHYIYYEKNPQMQNYMVTERRKNGITPSESVEDKAAKDFRNIVKERFEIQEQRKSSRTMYATSVLLVLVVLVIGVTTINNYDKMQLVQNSLEDIGLSVENKEKDTESVEAGSGQIIVKDEVEAEPVTPEPEEQPKEEPTEEKPQEPSVAEGDTDENDETGDDIYTVVKGDTLAMISKKVYGDIGHVDAICRMNGLEDGNLIFIGQKLLLP